MNDVLTLQKTHIVVDLTHGLNPTIPSWQGGCGFKPEIKLDYKEDELSFRVQKISMHAGIGTHMDAPSHCIPHGANIADIEVNQLLSPAVVIKAPPEVSPDFSFTVDDVLEYEKSYGIIAPGSCVLFYSSWDRYWLEPLKYRNDHQFPSLHGDIGPLLVERGVSGVGIDTLSPDRPSDGFPIHESLLGSGRYILENVAHLGQLPAQGALLIALPLKFEQGTESPARVVALVPRT